MKEIDQLKQENEQIKQENEQIRNVIQYKFNFAETFDNQDPRIIIPNKQTPIRIIFSLEEDKGFSTF